MLRNTQATSMVYLHLYTVVSLHTTVVYTVVHNLHLYIYPRYLHTIHAISTLSHATLRVSHTSTAPRNHHTYFSTVPSRFVAIVFFSRGTRLYTRTRTYVLGKLRFNLTKGVKETSVSNIAILCMKGSNAATSHSRQGI